MGSQILIFTLLSASSLEIANDRIFPASFSQALVHHHDDAKMSNYEL